MLLYEYAVKYRGQFYPPNTPIVEAADAAQEPAPVEGGANTPENVEAPKKAARGRKKGDA